MTTIKNMRWEKNFNGEHELLFTNKMGKTDIAAYVKYSSASRGYIINFWDVSGETFHYPENFNKPDDAKNFALENALPAINWRVTSVKEVAKRVYNGRKTVERAPKSDEWGDHVSARNDGGAFEVDTYIRAKIEIRYMEADFKGVKVYRSEEIRVA